MSRLQGDSGLTPEEQTLYNVIRSNTDTGIGVFLLKRQANLRKLEFDKSLKSIQVKSLIKEVSTFQKKAERHFMAVEFEPSQEISGGVWYVDGKLDKELINVLKSHCVKLISKKGVATLEGISEAIRRSGIFNIEFTSEQIKQIIRALVLDDEIMEVKSIGMGEFDSIPVGEICYKSRKRSGRGEPSLGAMASIPCGVCPVISLCTPNGLISPKTCKYYSKLLDF